MTAPTADRLRTRPPVPRRARPASPWTGTRALVGHALRLDRVRITAWTASTALVVAGSVASLEVTYPDQAALQARAALLDNPASVMMTGPAFGTDHYTFGAMVANELLLWLLVAAALISVLLVVRHTRAEEESGRAEMLLALPVGRHAPAAAAMVTVAVANLAVAAGVVAALVGTGLAVPDAVATGLGTALTGLVFAGVAALAAQLDEHARAATGTAAAVLGAAFVVRGVGDVLADGGSWLSWLSPLAWVQQTRPWVDLRWWPLALSAAAVVVTLAAAVLLARRRDVGAGLRRPAPGPARASAALETPAGLAWRLVRGTATAWAVGASACALAFGALADSLEDAFDDIPELGEWVAVDLGDVTTGFASAIVSFLLVAAVVVAVQGVLRLRAEEEAGRLEALLVTGTSRTRLLAAWLGVVVLATVGVTLVTGVGAGVGVWTGTGDASWVWRLAGASLAYLPATLLLAGVAVALVGLVPRRAGLAWLPVAWLAVVLFLGTLLDLPAWARDLSPFTHTPAVPQEDLDALPLVVMTAVAVALTTLGAAALRRRDVGRV